MVKQSDTLERIKWRIDNRYWIRKSQYVALEILKWIDENNLSKNDFAKLVGKDIQTVNLWVKGSTDFMLSDIAKIEQVTGYELMPISFENKSIITQLFERYSIDFTQQAAKGKAIIDKYLNRKNLHK